MLFRPARPSDLDEICTLLATSRQSPDKIRAFLLADRHFDPAHIRVAWTGGRIVGCAKLYPRYMRIGTASIPVGGIGHVRTDPRHWQKGIASALLFECLSAMAIEGMVLAPLIAPRQTLFARRGWSSIPQTELEIPAAALAASPPAPARTAAAASATPTAAPASQEKAAPARNGQNAVRVGRLEAQDLDGLMALYETAGAARTGTLEREPDHWMAQLTILDLYGTVMLVARRAGEVVGYAVAQPRGTTVEILEVLLAPWAEDVWLPLLRAARDACGRPATLRAIVPADYTRLITSALGEQVSFQPRQDFMLRVVDPQRLLQLLAPLLAARLRDAPAPEALRVRVGPLRGGAVLCLRGTDVSVERPRRDDVETLPDTLFLHLLLGVEEAQTGLDEAPLQPVTRAVLAHLFPPQDWIFWRSEKF